MTERSVPTQVRPFCRRGAPCGCLAGWPEGVMDWSCGRRFRSRFQSARPRLFLCSTAHRFSVPTWALALESGDRTAAGAICGTGARHPRGLVRNGARAGRQTCDHGQFLRRQGQQLDANRPQMEASVSSARSPTCNRSVCRSSASLLQPDRTAKCGRLTLRRCRRAARRRALPAPRGGRPGACWAPDCPPSSPTY